MADKSQLAALELQLNQAACLVESVVSLLDQLSDSEGASALYGVRFIAQNALSIIRGTTDSVFAEISEVAA